MANPDRKMNRDRTVARDNTRVDDQDLKQYLELMRQEEPGSITEYVEEEPNILENYFGARDAAIKTVNEVTDPVYWADKAGIPGYVSIPTAILAGILGGKGLVSLGKKLGGAVERAGIKFGSQRGAIPNPFFDEENLRRMEEKAKHLDELKSRAENPDDVVQVDFETLPDRLSKTQVATDPADDILRAGDGEVTVAKKVYPKLSDDEVDLMRAEEIAKANRLEREGLQRGVELRYPRPTEEMMHQEFQDLLQEAMIQGKPMDKIIGMLKSPNVRP